MRTSIDSSCREIASEKRNDWFESSPDKTPKRLTSLVDYEDLYIERRKRLAWVRLWSNNNYTTDGYNPCVVCPEAYCCQGKLQSIWSGISEKLFLYINRSLCFFRILILESGMKTFISVILCLQTYMRWVCMCSSEFLLWQVLHQY